MFRPQAKFTQFLWRSFAARSRDFIISASHTSWYYSYADGLRYGELLLYFALYYDIGEATYADF